jgi:hypothetical protein
VWHVPEQFAEEVWGVEALTCSPLSIST